MKCPRCDKKIELGDNDSGGSTCPGCGCHIKIQVIKGHDATPCNQDIQLEESGPAIPASIPSHRNASGGVSTQSPIAQREAESVEGKGTLNTCPLNSIAFIAAKALTLSRTFPPHTQQQTHEN